MANSAIYSCSRQTGYFPLQPLKGVSGNAYATRAAICQNGGKIGSTYEVTNKGIIGTDGRARTTPYLLVRLHSKTKQYLTAEKLFIGDGELAGLAGHFELPGALLDGAFCTLEKGSNFKRSVIDIQPSFFELLEPAWKNEYLDWLRSPGGKLPEPSRFPWEVLLPTIVTMPALDGAQSFDRVKGQQLGGNELQLLFSASGDPRAILTGAKWEKPENFVLGPEGFYAIGDSTYEGEALDNQRLSKLLLGVKGFERCSFRRRASDYEAHYGSFRLSGVNKEGLLIHTQSVFKLVPGAEYYFTFRRQPNRLICNCYADPQRETLLGRVETETVPGYFRPNFVLSRPNE